MQRLCTPAVLLGWLGMVLSNAVLSSTELRAQDDPPKPPVVLVKGTVVYSGKGQQDITVTLTPEDTKVKPFTTTSDEKGVFVFTDDMPVGKYKLTAKGKTSDGIRRLREQEAMEVKIEKDAKKPIIATVKLTTD